MSLPRKLLCVIPVLLLGTALFAAPEYKAKTKSAKPAVKPSSLSSAKMDAIALARFIDKGIDDRLKTENVSPSPLSSDAEFLRRLYLDVTGHIPTAEQAAAFLDSNDPQKRAKLIDELLASPDYGKRLADVWQTLLLRKTSDNRRLNGEPLTTWLEQSFNKNKPWNRMVHELITASGSQEDNGAVTFFLSNSSVDKMTDEVCKLFLGVQLQCAQCHNHPFTEWKQTEYWGMAAFFMKVQVPNGKQAKNGNSSVRDVDNVKRGKNALPASAKMVSPKFLGGDSPRVGGFISPRKVLADWLTTEQNPYFSKAMVNRVWAQYLGRGIVNPVDDMHDDNPASHPQVLAELANQFGKNGFDLKYLVRAICNSQAYQRSSKPVSGNREAEPSLYAHMNVKVLTPEQLYDSLTATLGKPDPRNEEKRKGMGMGKKAGTPRAAFVNFFGIDETVASTEYQAGIPQALTLMNSPRINSAVQNSALVRSSKPAAEVIDRLFLSTVSRRPTAPERERLNAYIQKMGSGTKAYGDIFWALLNSTEFTLNH